MSKQEATQQASMPSMSIIMTCVVHIQPVPKGTWLSVTADMAMTIHNTCKQAGREKGRERKREGQREREREGGTG